MCPLELPTAFLLHFCRLGEVITMKLCAPLRCVLLVYQCPTRRDNMYTILSYQIILFSWSSSIEFATKKSHLIFDGQYYDQIDGVAMGSPLGPILANIFMCHFEESWLTNNQCRPSSWFRYVEDTFSLFDSKDTASRFLDFLNGRHPWNSKRTERPHSWMFISSVITTHFKLLCTTRKLSLVFTPSGTLLIQESVRSI